MYELPTSLTVNGRSLTIRNRGDFRVVIDCFNCLEDEELTLQERVLSSLIIFFEDFNCLEDVYDLPDIEDIYKEVVRFFNCGQDKAPGAESNYRLLDWEEDSNLICSAVNKVAGKEVRAVDYMHWWTFIGYYMEVGESSLSTVVRIRYKMATNQKLEDYEKKFRKNNPHYFNLDMRTFAQREADLRMRSLWNQS